MQADALLLSHRPSPTQIISICTQCFLYSKCVMHIIVNNYAVRQASIIMPVLQNVGLRLGESGRT